MCVCVCVCVCACVMNTHLGAVDKSGMLSWRRNQHKKTQQYNRYYHAGYVHQSFFQVFFVCLPAQRTFTPCTKIKPTTKEDGSLFVRECPSKGHTAVCSSGVVNAENSSLRSLVSGRGQA